MFDNFITSNLLKYLLIFIYIDKSAQMLHNSYILNITNGGKEIMPSWSKLILEMLVFAIAILIIYNGLKYFILDKVKVNRWIVIAIAIVFLVAPSFLGVDQKNPLWVYGPSGIFIILFLWFIDLSGWSKRKAADNASINTYYKKGNKKDIKIKPKAKPNRVKNKKD